MNSQFNLFDAAQPPSVDGAHVIVGGAAENAAIADGCTLVHADPPWSYRDSGLSGAACNHYGLIPDEGEIAAHLDGAFPYAAADSYLFVWCTWPKLAEWMDVHRSMRWRFVSGGSWHKTGRLGVGFHLRGDSEPWLLYAKGKPRPRANRYLSNAYTSERGKHSEKPVGFLRALVESHHNGGGVADFYAGLAPLARACVSAGVPYTGVEIDPERASAARALLARGLR